MPAEAQAVPGHGMIARGDGLAERGLDLADGIEQAQAGARHEHGIDGARAAKLDRGVADRGLVDARGPAGRPPR